MGLKPLSQENLSSGFAPMLGLIQLTQLQRLGAQWLSGNVFVLRPMGCRFEPLWRHYTVSLSKTR